jgi:putative ABC transport system permease protein
MIRHHLILLYRSFLRSKGYFIINLTGLTAGLACTLLIYLWVRDELRMDKFNLKEDSLFQVMEHQQYADHIMTTTSTPGLLAETLKEEMPEVEYAATITWVNTYTLSVGETNSKADGLHVGPDFFNIFSYPLVEGSPDNVLTDNYSIVITPELAIRLFGTATNVVGNTIELQHKKQFHVTGLFNKIPASSWQFDFVLSYDELKSEQEWLRSWSSNGPSTHIILHEGSDWRVLSEKIAGFVKKRNEQSNVTLFLKPFSERYLYGRYKDGKPAGGRIEYVRLFSIIAIFMLLIACINFMNLSTARASHRAKEVGIRKSIGAQRQSLVIQYLSESLAMTLLSFVLACFIVWLFLPQFNSITSKQITIQLDDPNLLLWFTGTALVTGLLAGSYPALFLSGFKPAAVLKGEVRGSWGELWARKGLVVFQFFMSVILIVSVLVIYNQIEFVQSKNLGYNKDNLIRFPIEGRVETSLEAFLTEVKRIPGVVNASSIGHQLLGRNNNTSGLQWEGKPTDELILFENIRVNHNMLETLGVEMADGRSFSMEFVSDTSAIIFNEAGIRAMNLKEPIGKHIKLWDKYDLKIIGVVKDFHFQSLHDVVNPLFFVLNPRNTWNIMVRMEGGKEKETLAELANLYSTFNPGFAFEYTFQDQEFARLYSAEQRVASLSGYFAGFAILISCLGLFGLATFTAERRLKEIGIRKALGASSTRIVVLLSADFTRMVIISIGLGLPVSYWLLQEWLQRFAFRVELEPWYFVVAGLIVLLIAWVTVASQAIRAATVNPVECLRDE